MQTHTQSDRRTRAKQVFSCLRSDTTVSLFILSSVLHSFPTDLRLIYSSEIKSRLQQQPVLFSSLLSLQEDGQFLVFGSCWEVKRFSLNNIFGFKGASHGPNDTSVPLSLESRQTEAAVDVDRGERKEVLPSTWSTDCFHTYAQWRFQHKTVTHGLSFVEIYKNSGR